MTSGETRCSLRHSFPTQLLSDALYPSTKNTGLHIKCKSILKFYVKYQRGCFSSRQRRVSHSLSELVRIWATLRTWVHSMSAGKKQHWLSESDVFRVTVSCIVFCDHLWLMFSWFCIYSVQVTGRRFTSVSGLNRAASKVPGKLSSWQHEVSVLARAQGWLESCLVYGSEENDCKPVRMELFIWSKCVEQLQKSLCCKIELIPVCACSSNEGYLSWEQIPYGASQ